MLWRLAEGVALKAEEAGLQTSALKKEVQVPEKPPSHGGQKKERTDNCPTKGILRRVGAVLAIEKSIPGSDLQEARIDAQIRLSIP
jgi:hypothetical protein